MASEAPAGRSLLGRLIVARPGEAPAVAVGFLLFFLLFVAYFMLRPVRETFGIAGGVDKLQWLWTGTFVAMLVVVPLYGWVAARMPRRRLLPILYSLSALIMAGFATSLLLDPTNIWIARAFYIWLSVMNLFVVSLAWSLMVDLFDADQAHRLFGQIAAGAGLGGLTGPLISGLLVAPLGEPGLLYLSSALLLATLPCVRVLLSWREKTGPRAEAGAPASNRIGGSIWAGLTLIARSPYLLAISGFILLLTAATTFLYFEQARIVEATFPDRTRHLPRARLRDDPAARRRICADPPRPRDAVHPRRYRDQIQSQECHRHRRLSRRRYAHRLGLYGGIDPRLHPDGGDCRRRARGGVGAVGLSHRPPPRRGRTGGGAGARLRDRL